MPRKTKECTGKKIERENLLKSLPKLSENIIVLLREHGKLSLRELVKMTRANRNTVKAHLFKLVAEKQINKDGVGKGTIYFL